MAIFNSYVKLPEGTETEVLFLYPKKKVMEALGTCMFVFKMDLPNGYLFLLEI